MELYSALEVPLLLNFDRYLALRADHGPCQSRQDAFSVKKMANIAVQRSNANASLEFLMADWAVCGPEHLMSRKRKRYKRVFQVY